MPNFSNRPRIFLFYHSYIFLYELIVLHCLFGVACYMDCEWELSFRLGMRPWIAITYSAPIVAAVIVFLSTQLIEKVFLMICL